MKAAAVFLVAFLVIASGVEAERHHLKRALRRSLTFNALLARNPPIPNVGAILGPANGQTPLQVNKAINQGYNAFAFLLQKHLDPQFNIQSRQSAAADPCYPNWFAFAPWASLQVGRGELSAHAVQHALNMAGGNVGKYVDEVCKIINTKTQWSGTMKSTICGSLKAMNTVSNVAEGAGEVVDKAKDTAWSLARNIIPDSLEKHVPSVPDVSDAMKGGTEMLQLAAAFWIHIGIGMVKSMDSGNMAAVFSWDVIKAMAERVVEVLKSKTGGPIARVLQILQSLENGLKRGNILIFGDIGRGGENFLRFIGQQQNPNFTPETVLAAAGQIGGQGATQADSTTVFNAALAQLNRPVATFYNQQPFSAFKNGNPSRNYMVAACALWQKAKLTTNMQQKNLMISWGNNLLAYREQAIAVQPAFDMDRKLFHMMSPFIMLEDGTGVWTLQQYAAQKGKALSSYDWGDFSQRWPPIVEGAFTAGYQHRKNVFKFPNPDVTQIP